MPKKIDTATSTRKNKPTDAGVSKDKKKKDPNAPKRPLTAYFLFMNEKREEVKKEQPDLKAKEIIKALAEQWRALSDEGKKKFNNLAAKEKERYDEEVKEYKAIETEE